jgi:uncharacterized protein (TIGR03435 family)
VEDPNAPKPEPGKPYVVGRDGVRNPRPGTSMSSLSADGKRRMAASKRPILALADALASQIGRPVLDKTGLAGDYDYSLEFRADGPSAAPPGQQGPSPDASDIPDIFTAVQEQLGLKLESKKGPVEMLVVDRGEKVPTEN